MKISEALKKLFLDNNLNPYSFSQKYGGTDVTYRNIIDGYTSKLSFKVKNRIEKAFDITIDDSDLTNVTIIYKNKFNDTSAKLLITDINDHYSADSEPKLLVSYFPRRKDYKEPFKFILNETIENYITIPLRYGLIFGARIPMDSNYDNMLTAVRSDEKGIAMNYIGIYTTIPNTNLFMFYGNNRNVVFEKDKVSVYEIFFIKQK